MDCADPGALAEFWSLALGYVEPEPPDGFGSWEEWLTANGVPEAEWNDGAHLADPDGQLPNLSLLRVPEGKVAKNRLHPDLQVSGGRSAPQADRVARITATVERLQRAGATVLNYYYVEDRLDHVMLADPEGNEFCVV